MTEEVRALIEILSLAPTQNLLDKNQVLQFWKKQHPTGRPPIDILHSNGEEQNENKIFTIEDPINEKTYCVTHQGFRVYDDAEFCDYNKKIFCFGCSITYGLANNVEETWPFLLAKKLNARPYNFGVCGSSTDSIARRLFQLFSVLPKGEEPDHIFILFPDIFRREYIFNNGSRPDVLHFSASRKNRDTIKQYLDSLPNLPVKQVISAFSYTTAMTGFFNFVKNFRLIESILDSRGVSWSWTTWHPTLGILSKQAVLEYLNDKTDLKEDGLNIITHTEYPLAKDGCHPLAQYMHALTDQFLKIYNDRNIIK